MKPLIEILDIEEKVKLLYERMFAKYYNDEALYGWKRIDFFGGGNGNKYKSEIRRLLHERKRVKTGYKTSKKIRGSKTYYIFYK